MVQKELINERLNKIREWVIADPSTPLTEMSRRLGYPENTLSLWKYRNTHGFKEKYAEWLKEAFDNYEGLAIRTLGDLLVDGNWNATKYVLDNKGFAPTEKVKLDANVDNKVQIIDDVKNETN